MRVRILTFLIILCCAHGFSAAAQDYVQVPVTVSKEKVRNRDGKVCWSHVVQEKQTLFSISRAYGVSIDDICAANPDSDLRNGLKKNAIILIPIVDSTEQANAESATSGESQTKAQQPAQEPQEQEYIIHTLRWYESVGDVARLYGVTVQEILQLNDISTMPKSRTKIKIPVKGNNEAVRAEVESVPVTHEPEADQVKSEPEQEKETAQDHGLFPSWNLFNKKSADVVLMLPFNAGSENPNGNSLEFYSGALLAAKELGEAGYDVEMSVYDVAGGKLPITESRLSKSDMVVGPISAEDLSKVLALAPSSLPVISPLDPKAEALASSHSNLIHAPAPAEYQYRDMVSWIGSDLKSGDKALMISEKGATAQTSALKLKEIVRNSGLHVQEFTYGILEGRDIVTQFERIFTKEGTNRVIIASESEAFVNDVVRNLNLMIYKEFDVVLYSPSRIRSYNTIEVENLHNVNLHASLSYYIDYNSKDVTDFLMEYRALFNSEPTQFSYQGYDIMKYCILASCRNGGRWMDRLTHDGAGQMLQSTFLFSKSSEGLVNSGIRRVIYDKNYNIRLVR